MTLTPTLHADLFHRFKIAEGEASYESEQALCDSIESSRGNRKTTLCDPIFNASSIKPLWWLMAMENGIP